MYETYYSLSADPFRLSPDPRFCFEHPSFSRARKYMQYALRRAEGFIMVTGRPGTGKTTLVESLLAGISGNGPVAARLVTAQLGPDELLRKVAYAFGLHVAGLDKATMLLHLERFLVQQARTGRGALLVVDEAQGLNASSLEELRLLTNLQENARPILQIFLVGQEELRDIVQRPELEQFHQRLIAACHLRPLDPEETRAYVEHRLRRVGWRGDPRITSDAFELVHRFSAGVPRRINQVCSRLLLHGAAEDRHRLDGQDALAVIEDLRAELLAPAEIAETEELRDLLASLPKEPEPSTTELPPSTGPELVSPQPAPARPSPPAADRVATPVTKADVEPPPPPRQPQRVPTAAPPPAARAPGEPAAAAPSPARQPQPVPAASPAVASAGGRPSRAVPRERDAWSATPPEPVNAPLPRERPRRRLAARVLALFLVGLAAIPLLLALSPEFADRLQTKVSEWLSALPVLRSPAPPSTSGSVARRAGTQEAATPRAEGPSKGVETKTQATPEATTTLPAGTSPVRPTPASNEIPMAPRGASDETPATASPELPPVPVADEPTPAAADGVLSPRSGPSALPEPSSQPVLAESPSRTAPDSTDPEHELAPLGVSVRLLPDGTVHVNLRRQVPFDTNSAEVRPESRPFLDRLAAVLSRLDGFVVRVVGHTDDSGPRDYNVQLSRRRAEAVASYLRQQGVPTERLRAEGRSAGEPTLELEGVADGGPDRRRIDLLIQRAANSRA
jgi:putative secretion ATPase (PEP-CTERM system associated)